MKLIRWILVSLIVFLSASLLVRIGLFGAIKIGLLPEMVYISGTGSMFPTFPRGIGTESASLAKQTVASPKMHVYPGGINIFGKEILVLKLAHGDIVSFSNSKTKYMTLQMVGEQEGFVKRVIGLPGDQLEIRDGFVWLNGEEVKETYTAAPRSTFGGAFLSDCHVITVPPGKAFVMGDNRKSSSDSRHDLGFIDIADIDHILPLGEQTPYSKYWRDPSQDWKQAKIPVLETEDYVSLINEKRRENNLVELKYNKKLELSAEKRANIILKYNDYSFEATRSGYTMQKALKEVGYSNIVIGEAPTLGYYNAGELFENAMAFPDTIKFLMNKDFQETGISTKVGNLNGCPVQIVVQHFAGYVPPNYSSEVKESWKKALSQLKGLLPGWENVRQYESFYLVRGKDLEEAISLVKLRIEHIEAIVKRMEANQWLTEAEEGWSRQDMDDAKRLEELTSKLNKEIVDSL